MNDRLTKLEANSADTLRRLDRLDLLVAAIKDELNCMKVEFKQDINNAIRWIVGMMIAISMAGVTVMTFVLNNATPKVAPAPQPLPIVIYTAELPPARPVPPAK